MTILNKEQEVKNYIASIDVKYEVNQVKQHPLQTLFTLVFVLWGFAIFHNLVNNYTLNLFFIAPVYVYLFTKEATVRLYSLYKTIFVDVE